MAATRPGSGNSCGLPNVKSETPGVGGPSEALATVGRVLRDGAAAVIGAATDDTTVDALDKLAGPRWRIAAQAADLALVAARAAVGQRDVDEAGARAAVGEPAAFRPPDADDGDESSADDDSADANGTTGR